MRHRILGPALVFFAVLGGLNLALALTRTASREAPPTPAVTASLDPDTRVMIDRTFNVRAGELLFVDVQHADLTVETTSGPEARVVVTLESPDMDRAVREFERRHFSADHDATGIRVTSSMDERGVFRGLWDGVRMSIRVRVVVPEAYDLDLTSTHGDVALASHRGAVRVSTTHGDIQAVSLVGDMISIETTHGELAASSLAAKTISLETTHGNISLGTVTGDRLTASTSHSDVVIDLLAARAEVETSHGDVSMSVRETSGLRVETTHGDVTVELPKNFAADVHLEGDPVSLESATGFDGDRDEHEVVGSINGGGASIDISTTFGSVRVRG